MEKSPTFDIEKFRKENVRIERALKDITKDAKLRLQEYLEDEKLSYIRKEIRIVDIRNGIIKDTYNL